MNFRAFINEATQTDRDVKATLHKLPSRHRRLVRGYKFVFQSGNTLKGDKGHVGVIDDAKKTITVAAPWNYGREFTVIHEIAHLVWKHLMSPELRAKWSGIAKGTRNKVENNVEELFCHAYANHYVKHKVGGDHDHESWHAFIAKLK